MKEKLSNIIYDIEMEQLCDKGFDVLIPSHLTNVEGQDIAGSVFNTIQTGDIDILV
ncbi:actin-related protein 2-like [Bactrocera tryoni]|uniref:actin-related protein 2-like n=1 Tax=Bactrocera tryoni TaxID=59916 RepID=UPI001A95B059|nr:actin-related protein 2-like [Bactrocera tryoni]